MRIGIDMIKRFVVEIECPQCKHPVDLYPEVTIHNCFFCGVVLPKVVSVTINQMKIDIQGNVF